MSQPILVTPTTTNGVDITVGGQPKIGVAVGTTGPPGPAGALGPAGPAGPMGTLNVMELTQAEFEALPTKQPNYFYVVI